MQNLVDQILKSEIDEVHVVILNVMLATKNLAWVIKMFCNEGVIYDKQKESGFVFELIQYKYRKMRKPKAVAEIRDGSIKGIWSWVATHVFKLLELNKIRCELLLCASLMEILDFCNTTKCIFNEFEIILLK